MCRSCGAIVGGGEDHCAVCGASVAATSRPERARPVADRETLRFAKAILGRPYKFTIILLVANFFVFLLMWQSSGMNTAALRGFPEPILIRYGAKLDYLIRQDSQWWRFVTPMFVHVNLPHLLVNMYSLWVVGPYVERLYGSAKFLVFWVLTGVAGVVASYLTVVNPATPRGWIGRFLLKTQDVPSAGASGALFGLVGVLFIFGIKFRHELPEGFKRAFGTGMLPIILINLFIGYLGRGFIDNAAHLGGLVSGAMLALVVAYRRPGERAGVTVFWYLLQAAAIILVAISFVKVAQHFRDPLPVQLLTQTPLRSPSKDAEFLSYAQAMNQAQEVFSTLLIKHEVSGVEEAIKGLESAPSLGEKANELRERLKGLLTRGKKLTEDLGTAGERPPRSLQQQKNQLTQEFMVFNKDYTKWLKTEAKNYSGLN